VVLLETPRPPEALLERLLEIERTMGRKRTVKWGPRNIDLDVLCYDRLIVRKPDLIVPHPFLEKRKFVLEPMAEIAPDYVHPVLQKTMAELKDAWQGEGQNLVRIV
jgi:2-amino-4-hydroxy-6-hydroxymethyldihydropteridine diphosphokinase